MAVEGELARVQVKQTRKRTVREGEVFNLWYQKKEGRQPYIKRHEKGGPEQEQGGGGGMLRCDPIRDSGWTQGNDREKVSGGRVWICLHFARGECTLGAKCSFLHRVPNSQDQERLDELHDIFGRERFKEHKDDMGGVGSFLSDSRTLYIGNLPPLRWALAEIYRTVAVNFGLWGPISHCRVLVDRNIAFVTYRWRASAEFAKEAMIDQQLLPDRPERLNVRWARPDPNPLAVKRNQLENTHLAISAVRQSLLSSSSSSSSSSSEPILQLLQSKDASSDQFGKEKDETKKEDQKEDLKKDQTGNDEDESEDDESEDDESESDEGESEESESELKKKPQAVSLVPYAISDSDDDSDSDDSD